MARTRQIKPGFFDNEDLGELPPLTRLLFAGLWCYQDREGRCEDRPRRLKKQLLPYDDEADVDAMLDQLQDAGFIKRYEVDGCKYIWTCKFKINQRVAGSETASEIPPYVNDGAECRNSGAEYSNSGAPAPNIRRTYLVSRSLNLVSRSLEEEGATDVANPPPDESVQESFDEFWALYPHRGGVKKHKKAAISKWRSLAPEDRSKVMQGVNKAIAVKEIREGIGVPDAHRFFDPEGGVRKRGPPRWMAWYEMEVDASAGVDHSAKALFGDK